MVAKNEITGHELRSKPLSDEGKKNYETIFGNKGVQKGSWVMRDGKLVPKGESQARHGCDVFVKGFEAYESPIDGTVISNARQRDYDLKKNGCRPYEGLKSERGEADSHNKEAEAHANKVVRQDLEKNYYALENGYKIS